MVLCLLRRPGHKGEDPVCAILIKIALGNTSHFKNGREAAAYFGLTRVQHSSGGKEKIGKTDLQETVRAEVYKTAQQKSRDDAKTSVSRGSTSV